MAWNWFDVSFPWIGLAGAVALLILLFGTDYLRSDLNSSRWRDLVWLSWLGAVAYLLHNVEEYGMDLLGNSHAFPAAICANMNLPAYPSCPVPPTYFLAVNITMFWVAAPLAALISRRHPLVGLAVYSVIFINTFLHVVPALVLGMGYNPGMGTAVLIFLPLSLWLIYACFGAGRISYKALVFLIMCGILFHVILTVPMILFLRGFIGSTTLVLTQIANAGLLLANCWWGENWRGGILVRS